MSKNKIYVSFDQNNDRDLKNMIVGGSQAEGAGYKVAGWSSKIGDNEKIWRKETKFKMSRCDMFLLLIGENTTNVDVVKKELDLAKSLGLKITQLSSHPDYPTFEDAGEATDLNEEALTSL